MNGKPPGPRPLSFYVNLAVAAVLFLLAAVIFTGGVDFGAGPLRLRIAGTERLSLVLLALLVLRRVVSRDGEGKGWKEALFGDPGSTKEHWRIPEALFLFCALYVFLVGGAALARHRNFLPDGSSLAAAVQATWGTANGSPLATSLADGGNYLGLKFSPVLVFLTPVARLFPGPELFIRLQTWFIVLGALPLYLLARRELEDRRWALALAGLYCLHPAVRGMNLAPFDPVTLAVAPLLAAFFLLDVRPGWIGYLCVVFALLCGEEAWLVVSALGLYLCLVRRRWREGIFVALVTFYGYLFITTFVIPKIGGFEAASPLSRISDELGRIPEVFADPAGRTHLVGLFAPLAGLSLLAPLRLAVGLPQLVLNLFSEGGGRLPLQSSASAVFVPFIFAAAVRGLRRLRHGWGLRRVKILSGPLLRYGLIVLPLYFFGPSPALQRGQVPPQGFLEGFVEAASMIPDDAPLSVSEQFLSRFAQRRELSVFPETSGARYVLIEAGRGEGEGDAPAGEDLDSAARLVREEGFEVLRRDGFFLLLGEKE